MPCFSHGSYPRPTSNLRQQPLQRKEENKACILFRIVSVKVNMNESKSGMQRQTHDPIWTRYSREIWAVIKCRITGWTVRTRTGKDKSFPVAITSHRISVGGNECEGFITRRTCMSLGRKISSFGNPNFEPDIKLRRKGQPRGASERQLFMPVHRT